MEFDVTWSHHCYNQNDHNNRGEKTCVCGSHQATSWRSVCPENVCLTYGLGFSGLSDDDQERLLLCLNDGRVILTYQTSCRGNDCGGACRGREVCDAGAVVNNGGLRGENVHCWESNGHCGDCTTETQTSCMGETTCLLQEEGVGLQGGEAVVAS